MKCLFVGPTAKSSPCPEGVDRFGPATMGSIFLAVQNGYTTIGIVDGQFGNVPSIWHKEIIYALSQNVSVLGASSMGALRAAEMHNYGVIGVGKIYRYFRCGILEDDDEVCVIHSIKELNYHELSLPMVNIRKTFMRLKRLELINETEYSFFCPTLKDQHFSLRTINTIEKLARSTLGFKRANKFISNFIEYYCDQKHSDYEELINLLKHNYPLKTPQLKWSEIKTRKWVTQFEREVKDIPKIESW